MPSVNHSAAAFRSRVQARQAQQCCHLESTAPGQQKFLKRWRPWNFALPDNKLLRTQMHTTPVSTCSSPKQSSILRISSWGKKGAEPRANNGLQTIPEAAPAAHAAAAHVTCSSNAAPTSAVCRERKNLGSTARGLHISSWTKKKPSVYPGTFSPSFLLSSKKGKEIHE